MTGEALLGSLLPWLTFGGEPPAPIDDIDIDGLTAPADRHSLVPLLHERFSHLSIKRALPTVWGRRREDILAINLAYRASLGQIAEKYQGPPFMLLQGTALLDATYGDLSLRPMSDADLLVPPVGRAALEKTIAENGFTRDPGYRSLFHKGRLTLDLHDHPAGADRIRSRRLLFGKGYPDMSLMNFRPSTTHPRIAVMEDDAHFILDAIHALKHSCSRWVWFVDSALRIRAGGQGFFGRAMTLADTWGCIKALECYLRIFNRAIPSCAAPLPVAGRGLTGKLEAAVFPGPGPEFTGELILASTVRGVSGKVRYFMETLWPRNEVLREMAGQGSPPLAALYMKRMMKIAMMALKGIWSYVRSPACRRQT